VLCWVTAVALARQACADASSRTGEHVARVIGTAKNGWPSGVAKTVIGPAALAVSAWGRGNVDGVDVGPHRGRPYRHETSFDLIRDRGVSNDSCAITWHQWRPSIPNRDQYGYVALLRLANASVDQGHQSTGCRSAAGRYGDWRWQGGVTVPLLHTRDAPRRYPVGGGHRRRPA